MLDYSRYRIEDISLLDDESLVVRAYDFGEDVFSCIELWDFDESIVYELYPQLIDYYSALRAEVSRRDLDFELAEFAYNARFC